MTRLGQGDLRRRRDLLECLPRCSSFSKRVSRATRVGFIVWLGILTIGGCADTTPQEADYASQATASARRSLNGTSVFAEMYRTQGYDVDSWSRMSPRMDQYNTIVWFPDSYKLPDPKVQSRISDWLLAGSNRTFVYVGRDFDAEEYYWQLLVDQAIARQDPPEQITLLRRRLAYAQSAVDERRRRQDAIFFAEDAPATSSVDPVNIKEFPSELIAGEWADRFQLEESDILVYPKFGDEPLSELYYDDYETLLAVGGEPIVERYQLFGYYDTNDSQLIYVQNGSFLLNLPLVNHEHRKMAAAIIRESGQGNDVLFLESGPSGIEVIEHIDDSRQPTPWDWVAVWPMNFIVPHLFFLAVLFCVAYYPIFGRAKDDAHSGERNDFGDHLRSLGALFAKTGQSDYMLDKIGYYEEHVRRDSGTSHLKK